MLKKELEGIMSRYIFMICLSHSVYINFKVGLFKDSIDYVVRDSELYFHFISHSYSNFLFYFNFLILNLRLEVSIMSYITVIYPSHVKITVIQSCITQKNIESSGIMILYSMFTIC